MPIYMKYDGIDGEAVAPGHEGWIELNSFSWGMSQGAGRRTSVGQFSTQRRCDKATPLLFQACAAGQHIKHAELRTVSPRSGVSCYVKLYDILISSYQTGGAIGGGDAPTESLSLNFAKYEISHHKEWIG